MPRNTFIKLAVVFGIILALLLGYYFLFKPSSDGTPGVGTQVFKNFFPFGGNELPPPSNTGTTTEPVGGGEPNNQDFVKKLRKLSAEPVAGAGTQDVKAGSIVRYIEKATGHIFEVELFSSNKNRISNTTIPVVADAMWGNKNNSLIARYLKDDNQTVDTFSLTLKSVSTSTENTISGIAFPGNIGDVSVNGTNVFYLQQNSAASVGIIANFDGSGKKEIWNSPIKDVLSQFVNAKTVAITTKPAQNLPGYLYFIDTATGGVRKILSNIAGLSTLVSPDAVKVLYMENTTFTNMNVFDTSNKSSTQVTPTTLPEKCVWSTKDKNVVYCGVPREVMTGSTLTDWYMGKVLFTDDIWKYDVKNGTAGIVLDLSSEAGESIDVLKPILSTSEQYLIFMNKRDNTLWSLDLTK